METKGADTVVHGMYGHSYVSVHIVNSIQYMQNKVYHIYFSIPQIPRRPDSLSVVAYGYKVPHVTLQLSAAYKLPVSGDLQLLGPGSCLRNASCLGSVASCLLQINLAVHVIFSWCLTAD